MDPLFQIMNDILGKKPFMSPISTTSSTGKKVSSSECRTSSLDSCFDKEENPHPSKLIYYI